MQPGHDASGGRRWPCSGVERCRGGVEAEADGGLEGLHYASESGRDSYIYLAVSNARRDGNVLPEYSRKLEFMVERDRDTHTMCFHSLIMNNCDVQRASLDSLGYESDDAPVDVYPRRTRVLTLRGIALERIFHPTDFSRIFISHCVPGRLSMVWGQDFARWVVCTQFYPVIGSMNNDPGF